MKRSAALFVMLSLIVLLLTGGISGKSQSHTPQSPGKFNLDGYYLKSRSSFLSQPRMPGTRANTIPVTGLADPDVVKRFQPVV